MTPLDHSRDLSDLGVKNIQVDFGSQRRVLEEDNYDCDDDCSSKGGLNTTLKVFSYIEDVAEVLSLIHI